MRQGQRHRGIDWVFLDRDGTINSKPADGDYVKHPNELTLLPGAAAAIRRLNEARVWVGVVTNQRGIARGRMTEAEFFRVQARLAHELALCGAHIDAVYHCPHEEGTCTCRKPAPGMLLLAERAVAGLELSHAALIGDSPSDVEAGRRAGVLTVLLSGDDPAQVLTAHADHVTESLAAAVDWLLSPARLLGSI